MTELELTATAERILFRLADLAHFQLANRTPNTALLILTRRFKEEVADSVQHTYRTDALATDCRYFSNMSARYHGPKIDKIVREVALRALPRKI